MPNFTERNFSALRLFSYEVHLDLVHYTVHCALQAARLCQCQSARAPLRNSLVTRGPRLARKLVGMTSAEILEQQSCSARGPRISRRPPIRGAPVVDRRRAESRLPTPESRVPSLPICQSCSRQLPKLSQQNHSTDSVDRRPSRLETAPLRGAPLPLARPAARPGPRAGPGADYMILYLISQVSNLGTILAPTCH